MGKTVIHTLHCGDMNVRPREAYIKDPVFGPRVKLPVNAFLIEHPVHGNILVDTGWSRDAGKILPRYLLDFYRPEIDEEHTAMSQLRAIGLKPEDIDVLLLTHLDVDHTCALRDFVHRAKRIVCAELEYFYSCRMVYKMRQVWDTWMPWNDCIDKIYYRASSLGPVGRGFDLFDDGSILCIYCPGHTDGIFSTIVSQEPSNRFMTAGSGEYGGEYAVLASDLAFSRRNLDNLVVPGYGFDRAQQLNSVKFLKQLQDDSKCSCILFSHDSPPQEEITLN